MGASIIRALSSSGLRVSIYNYKSHGMYVLVYLIALTKDYDMGEMLK
jgi:hypothetical protein